MRPLVTAEGVRPRMAVFLSGGGSNARVILEHHERLRDESPFEPVALVTDKPEESGARVIGEEFGVPVVAHDVRSFYRTRGLKRISVATPEGWAAREAWTEALRVKLRPYSIDFGVFAGFELLSNISADFPCLNVHPGDLTYLRDGRRYLVGLHTIPVERALLEGLTGLRSSVLLVTPYTGKTDDMDSGPLLGISPPVDVDLGGHSLASLRTLASRRPAERPPGGYGDLLEELAAHNQERLKERGDWIVFPQVVCAAAAGLFAVGDQNEVYYRSGTGAPFQAAQRLVFGPEGLLTAESARE